MATKYALVNNENLTVPKVGTSLRAMELWATRLCGYDDYSIIDITSRKGLSLYTPMELQILYRHIKGEDLTKSDYADRIVSVHAVLNELSVDDIEPETIESWFDTVPSGSDVGPDERDRRYRNKQHGIAPTTPKETTRSAPTTPRTSGVGTTTGGTRPKGGTTARVWAIADEVKGREDWADADVKAIRAEVMRICGEEDINPSTASTQFGKWKRDQNL